MNYDQRERLRSFFYAGLDNKALQLLESLGIRKYWTAASELCAVEAGQMLYMSSGTHRNFAQRRYQTFRDLLEAGGVIPAGDMVGLSVVCGVLSLPYGADY